MPIVAVNRVQLSRRALQGVGGWGRFNQRGTGGEKKTQCLHQRGPGRRGGGELGCDVDRPSIMAAAAAFLQSELNLETEGSLLSSWASPLLCILLQSAALMCCKSMQHAMCSPMCISGRVASQHK